MLCNHHKLFLLIPRSLQPDDVNIDISNVNYIGPDKTLSLKYQWSNDMTSGYNDIWIRKLVFVIIEQLLNSML